MKPQTWKRRDASVFCNNEVSILQRLEGKEINAEVVSQLLVGYGRRLYYAGKPALRDLQ